MSLLASTVLRWFLNFCKTCRSLFQGVFGVSERLQASPAPLHPKQASRQVKFNALVLTLHWTYLRENWTQKVTSMMKFKRRHSQISSVMKTLEKCNFKNQSYIKIYFRRKLFITPWFKLIWLQFCLFIKNPVQNLVDILGILACKSTSMWHLTEKGDR